MAAPPSDEQLEVLLASLQTDPSIHNPLLRIIWPRLQDLTRRLFVVFPRLRRTVEVDDVLQGALLRWLRERPNVCPASLAAFFALFAQQVRRELLDLVRRFHGPGSLRVCSLTEEEWQRLASGALEQADSELDLQQWSGFHEAVQRLPPEEREVVSLVFYQGCSQAEIADTSHVSVRTVRRRWRNALRKLRQAMEAEPQLR